MLAKGSGHAPLYLLDSRLPENHPDDQAITAHLYGGTEEVRIAQEIILGIGGVRLLRALGFDPKVYHFNEGHAMLAGTELIRLERLTGASFEGAWECVRQKILFTTHTPVPAGNESHSLGLLQEMGANNGLGRRETATLGEDPFNMTIAGLRLARIANGVSAMHGQTARAMWTGVDNAAPIIQITNGVHPATWQDPAVAAAQSPETLWEAHGAAKRALFSEVYARTGLWLNPRILTIGFARRTVAYKRPSLIFHDLERIGPLIREGRLQVIFSGKAHPQDDAAKQTVAELVEISNHFRGQVLILPNYEIRLGRLLTRGCDLWLNNPRPPLEASGTSGMKAAMNGVLNLSLLDGWWPEACSHGVNGWAFGYQAEPGSTNQFTVAEMDARDAASLYEVLLGDVVPAYYAERDRWLNMMRASIESTQEAFAIQRMVQQYGEKMYRV